MILKAVDRDSDDFDVAVGKFTRTTSHFAELGGADRCENTWVRGQNDLEEVSCCYGEAN